MADKISHHLHGDLDKVVPTTVMMVAITSVILGLVFYLMGLFRVTSIANYMPYPVIAGFLSGIGAQLMKNGVHMASSKAMTAAFFTWDVQVLVLPAIGFASFARLGQYLKVPVAISFPCLLVLSLVGFQVFAAVNNHSMETLGRDGWVFSWDPVVVAQTPMWYPWTEIDFHKVHWHTLTHETMGFTISLVILGALKYSVSTTSLSTLFGRDISPDNEMRVIGLANLASGLLGCCGGCHYLSAMGIMKQFEAHEKTAYLDKEGSAIFVLRLQGYLFFGTSVNILERMETRVHSLDFSKLQFVIIDFGLVPSFDATALLNFRKTSTLADMYMFDIYFCGLKPEIELALRQNHYSQRVHLLSSDVDIALELCENELLPDDICSAPSTPRVGKTFEDGKRMSQLELWEHFIAVSPEHDYGNSYQKLVPLSAYLDIVVVANGSQLVTERLRDDTYFICFGYMNFVADSEFSNAHNIPGIHFSEAGRDEGVDADYGDKHESGIGIDFDDAPGSGGSVFSRRKLSIVMPEESQWTPFTTAKSRLLKIGPGSVITPSVAGMDPTYKYIATSDCVMLRLRSAAMETLEARAPHSAVAVLKLINMRLAARFRHSSKRVSQMSSLLYK
ncbi:hypothetical protein BBJ29_007019 [Phytophthora kernoviae]|uniref:STAS domain-containing protein n=1 Tax=Phytophthora kernoviae TaxID=325452 RepID=A0A3F2RP16_9STRA|nr:hypothetical protein BBJ29_007019 [Phytophthora kernoviae]RLN61471.1 hypothetical protein BBP00_00005392 [Phytophthora kernoviae]